MILLDPPQRKRRSFNDLFGEKFSVLFLSRYAKVKNERKLIKSKGQEAKGNNIWHPCKVKQVQ